MTSSIKESSYLIKLFLALFTLLFTVSLVQGQSLSDIQNVKVDNLSDAQIEQLIKRAESSGMSEQQLEAMARERGMPATEVAKLRTRINQIRVGVGVNAATFGGENLAREGVTEEVSVQEEGPKLNDQEKKIFGYSLFRNSKISFSPNLNVPTPLNYTLGTGDQLLIDIYGASQQRYDQTINNEGMIFIPNIGPINLSGLSVEAATSRLKSTLTNIYSGLSGSNPNTFLQVRVGNIRSIQIVLIGQVYAPGNYTLSSFSTVFNALYAAGGITENGSFRAIKVYRDNILLTQLDIYDFLINADQSKNIRLQDNDVIMIPPVQKRVEIQGPLRRPGLFEIANNETLSDLIAFAGGFTSMAYPSRAIVYRTTEKELKVENIPDLQFENFIPKQGDNFVFGEILNRYENRVQVSGALRRPGTFAINQGMGIRELINEAEGLREDAFLNRATLYRTRPDFSLEIVAVDIGAVVRGEEEDIVLQREDVLNIPSIYDLREEFYVTISGEVNKPGAFAFGENMKVADLVLRAGGFNESATSAQIEIARRVRDDASGKLAEIFHIDIDRDLKFIGDNADMVLTPFDHVVVRRSPGFQRGKLVRIEGEVFFPGEYSIAHASERISDLLKRSGGLNQFAFPKGATLIRRNEFFSSPSDNQIKSTNLTEIKQNLQRIKRDATESEKILLFRIDQKITERGGDLSNKQGEGVMDDFRRETIESMVNEDGEEVIRIKTQEMIGIDLADIIGNPGGLNDLIIQEGDVLSIPKQLQTVRMRGEVLFPTTSRFRENAGFKSYISRAGGFTDRSEKKRSYVVYANGDVRKTKNLVFFKTYPSIEPGSEIIVPAKRDREPMPIQGWIALATSLATLGILVDRIVQ